MPKDKIMLATTFDESKVTFPVEVTEKLDGVAAHFYRTSEGWQVESRQGKPILSIGHIIRKLDICDDIDATHIYGELMVSGVPTFKKAAGIIRRKKEDSRIRLYIYDSVVGDSDEGYDSRRGGATIRHENCEFGSVPFIGIVDNLEELNETLIKEGERYLELNPNFEGFMIRCLYGEDSLLRVGKRSRGFMRYKPTPTVDLKIIGYKEATANKEMSFLGEKFQKGDCLRAVGSLIADYKGRAIGAGAGCLTHKERRQLWEAYNPDSFKPVIAEITYMRDPSYEALREAAFKRWREDKSEPSYES